MSNHSGCGNLLLTLSNQELVTVTTESENWLQEEEVEPQIIHAYDGIVTWRRDLNTLGQRLEDCGQILGKSFVSEWFPGISSSP